MTSSSPAFAIVDYAQEHNIDLIVMGTNGRGVLEHFLMGSVAERVVRLRRARCLRSGPPSATLCRPTPSPASATDGSTRMTTGIVVDAARPRSGSATPAASDVPARGQRLRPRAGLGAQETSRATCPAGASPRCRRSREDVDRADRDASPTSGRGSACRRNSWARLSKSGALLEEVGPWRQHYAAARHV